MPKRAGAAVVLLAGTFLGVFAPSSAARASVHLPPLPARLTVTATSGTPIPGSFFGLSIPYNQLSAYEAQGPVFDRVISLIHPEAGMVLRLGGRSADRAYWQASTRGASGAVNELGAPWLAQLSSLVRRDRLEVMLDVNLAVHSSMMAVDFARAMMRAVGRANLAGLTIGNEPDMYHRETFLTKERVPTTARSTPIDWTNDYSPSDYRRDFGAYANALRKSTAGIPIGGPELASASPKWVAAMEGLGRQAPQFVTIHRYASSYCFPPTSARYPSIPLMLSPSSSTGLASTLRAAIELARSHDQKLRVDELNSISCEGPSGVANSFATALWAPDTLFAMIRQGVDAVNWHIRPDMLNAPFETGAHGIEPLPELYGLALFAQMTPRGAQLVRSRLADTGLKLRAWAVRVPGGVRTLLINKGRRPAHVTMRMGSEGGGRAQVTRLKAPSIAALAGVRLGGRWIGSDGRWHGRQVSQTIKGHAGAYVVPVPGYSAALVRSR